MHHFKKLKVWQKSIELVTQIYVITKTFPKEETFGLISQIRRCAVSIPSNIAEGSGRSSDKDTLTFLNYSLGSSFELETQLIIAANLSYVTSETSEALLAVVQEVQKMLYQLIKKLTPLDN